MPDRTLLLTGQHEIHIKIANIPMLMYSSPKYHFLGPIQNNASPPMPFTARLKADPHSNRTISSAAPRQRNHNLVKMLRLKWPCLAANAFGRVKIAVVHPYAPRARMPSAVFQSGLARAPQFASFCPFSKFINRLAPIQKRQS